MSSSEPVSIGEQRQWGNGLYVNLDVGESVEFHGEMVRLDGVKGRRVDVSVDGETVSLTVPRRSVPTIVGNVRVFAADSRPVADLTDDNYENLHDALVGDALLCLSDPAKPLCNPERFAFPISRRDGYTWVMGEDSHMFAYLGPGRSHEGIDLSTHDARGSREHPAVAVDDAVVRRVTYDAAGAHQACVTLESVVDPGIFYVYKHLDDEAVTVVEGERVESGDEIGYIWGDHIWGHLHFSVVGYGDLPPYENRYRNVLNCFPQLYELYWKDLEPRSRTWTDEHWLIGHHRWLNHNQRRTHAFDPLVGYGWRLDDSCAAGRVECDYYGNLHPYEGHARVRKTLFEGTAAEWTNPDDHYDFEIGVPKGRYAVRAKVGSAEASAQRVEFEGKDAGEFVLNAGEFTWTEPVTAQVADGHLTVRLSLLDDSTPAGISELTFRRA